MKRVLIVSYWFPPQPAAGALRVGYLAEHLREFGWEPVVLTREFPGYAESGYTIATAREGFWRRSPAAPEPARATPARVRHPLEQRLRTLIKCVINVPDDHNTWMPAAMARAVSLARSHKIDAVLSSAPPATVHFVARNVATRFRIPWIADYRDLWSGPYGPYFSWIYGPVRLGILYAMERWLLRKATHITTVTKGHADALSKNFQRSDVEVIPNASDRSIWESIAEERPASFSLCYTGQLYPGLRMPDLLFSAVAKMRQMNDPAGLAARFDFYGNSPELVLQCAAKYGIADSVSSHGLVDRVTALRAQRRAAALVLLLNFEVDPIESANPGSKILEYAGSGRRILALGSASNVVKDALSETGLGVYASDEAECIAAIRRLFEYYQQGDITPVERPSDWFTSPRDLAQRFAAALDRVT
jgi:hypothetical protein